MKISSRRAARFQSSWGGGNHRKERNVWRPQLLKQRVRNLNIKQGQIQVTNSSGTTSGTYEGKVRAKARVALLHRLPNTCHTLEPTHTERSQRDSTVSNAIKVIVGKRETDKEHVRGDEHGLHDSCQRRVGVRVAQVVLPRQHNRLGLTDATVHLCDTKSANDDRGGQTQQKLGEQV